MDCKIIERTEKSTKIQIKNDEIKPISYMLVQSSFYYSAKFQVNFNKMLKNKIVPFFLEHFLIYLQKKNQQQEYLYLIGRKNKREQQQFKLQDLIQMFKHKPQENIQHQWLEYLESDAAIDVCQFICSKKVSMYYLRAIQDLQKNAMNHHPYRNYYSMEEMDKDQNDYSQSLNENDKYIIRKKIKNLDDINREFIPKEKMQIKYHL